MGDERTPPADESLTDLLARAQAIRDKSRATLDKAAAQDVALNDTLNRSTDDNQRHDQTNKD